MASTLYGIDIDTEKIQREALLILFDNLNDKIDELEQTWNANDSDLFNRMGRVAPDWTVEHISADNFHSGHLAPLMSRPISEYPNCCTTAYIAEPMGTNDDEGEMYRIRLAIEIMVLADNEDEANSRIKKTVEAAHKVFFDSYDNRTLNHTIVDLGRPRETTGELFTFNSDGKRWFWEGGSLDYPVTKYASLY